jgi:hypothetical protein
MLFMGCSDTSTQIEAHEMVISPQSLVFQHSDQVKTLSITHTCTCPFSWYVTVTPANGVLKDTTGYGDNTSVPLRIADRSKMTTDTLKTSYVITSNGYGTDTVAVTVIR